MYTVVTLRSSHVHCGYTEEVPCTLWLHLRGPMYTVVTLRRSHVYCGYTEELPCTLWLH